MSSIQKEEKITKNIVRGIDQNKKGREELYIS